MEDKDKIIENIKQQLNSLTYKEAKRILKVILIDIRENSIVTFVEEKKQS